MDVAVNDAVEQAHRSGILTCTSLMMGMPAVADAVIRAKCNPSLAVGLHITLTAGLSVLPHAQIPGLVDREQRFEDSMALAGTRYFFLPAVRRQLRAEIRAQFAAFKATGLPLDHVNAHRHFHLHPTLATMIVEIGREFGLRAMRAPYEPIGLLRRAAAEGETVSIPPYLPWVKYLGYRLRRAGLLTNDIIFGLQWTGAMTAARLLQLIPVLPNGITEIYLHPATARSPYLVAAMPTYRHVEEFEALVSPDVRHAIDRHAVELTTYSRILASRGAVAA